MSPLFLILIILDSERSCRDSVRYEWKHSILCDGSANGRETKGGQRLSIMIRVSVLNYLQILPRWSLTYTFDVESTTCVIISLTFSGCPRHSVGAVMRGRIWGVQTQPRQTGFATPVRLREPIGSCLSTRVHCKGESLVEVNSDNE